MATTIDPGPLPALDSLRVEKLNAHANPNRRCAYRMILQAERQAVRQEDIMSARVTGYLLLEFHEQSRIFSDRACSTLTKWVLSPPTNKGDSAHDVVYDLGTHLRDRFIRLFRSSNAPYQLPSSHPSRASFDTLEDMIKDAIDATGKDYKTSRRRALARDGFRCVITGMLNESSVKECPALQEEAQRNNINATTVDTAYILNESTMQGIHPTSKGSSRATPVANKADHASGAMAILVSFGFSDFTEAFGKSGGVQQIWNLLSLEPNVHKKFEKLKLWFEETQQRGCYKICLSDELDEGYIRRNFRHPRPHPMVVEFTSQIDQAPPPDPRLLALHATCARVAHMSGAAKFFDRLERDAEELEVLAFDGSSALLLSHLISPFATLDDVRYAQANT